MASYNYVARTTTKFFIQLKSNRGSTNRVRVRCFNKKQFNSYVVFEQLPQLLECSHIQRDFQWRSSSAPHVNHEKYREQQALIHSPQHQPADKIILTIFQTLALRKIT